MNYFSPKRFNRFPRFSAVLKGQGGSSMQEHLAEKTVCLNSEVYGLVPEQNHLLVPMPSNGYQLNQFDPFEKVILIKDIDNQVLTSFRTL